jgi:hypothetical protein
MKQWLIPLVLCQVAVAAMAQATKPEAGGSAAAQAASFRCGGVGEDERNRMKAEAARHDLLLTFATPGGALVADVDVELTRGAQVVLQGRCDGPLMLVDLAPGGSYQIRASYKGHEQRRTVTLGATRPTSVTFVWPDA